MSGVIVLDAGPLGALCNTRATTITLACNRWLEGLLAAKSHVVIPEVVDYEVRREMLRLGRKKNVARLDQLTLRLEYWPITTAAMRQAAEFWAEARQGGRPTAADRALDADMILAAQVATSGVRDAIVATTNPAHLSLFVSAELWQSIAP